MVIDRGACTAEAWRSSRSAATSSRRASPRPTRTRARALAVVTDASAAHRARRPVDVAGRRARRGRGLQVARGPHNIVRRVVEFAVEHPGIESTSARRPRSSRPCRCSRARARRLRAAVLRQPDAPAGLAAARRGGDAGGARRHRRVARAARSPSAPPTASSAGSSRRSNRSVRWRPATTRTGAARRRPTSTATGEGSSSTTPTSPSSGATRARVRHDRRALLPAPRVRAEDHRRQRRDPRQVRGREGGLTRATVLARYTCLRPSTQHHALAAAITPQHAAAASTCGS